MCKDHFEALELEYNNKSDDKKRIKELVYSIDVCYNSILCVISEGREFMTSDEIYDHTVKEIKKLYEISIKE